MPTAEPSSLRADPFTNLSTFYDSFGNVHQSRFEIDGTELRWIGERTRCTVTLADNGTTQLARHESSEDGVTWNPSMTVTLRKTS